MLITDYQPGWIDDFRALEQVFLSTPGLKTASVEHIGSTAVPGLAAKPIIDIDLVYEDEASGFGLIRTSLESLGYTHVGDQGIQGREVFKRQGELHHQILDTIRHHLYVCHRSSAELDRHLFFRNYLRKNAEARHAYAQLKRSIAEQAHQDKKRYAALKEIEARTFFESIFHHHTTTDS